MSRCNKTAFLALIFIVTSTLVTQIFLTLRSVLAFEGLDTPRLIRIRQVVRVIPEI